MAYDEIQDVGRATDKPKGFVKWSLIAYWSAILGLCGFIGKLLTVIDKNATECSVTIQKVMEQSARRESNMQQEYNRKLEDRINRLEHVEERVDKALPESKNSKK